MNKELFCFEKGASLHIGKILLMQVQQSETLVRGGSRYIDGYLSYLLSAKTLLGAINIEMLHIASVKKGPKKIKAFACGVPYSLAEEVTKLKETFSKMDSFSTEVKPERLIFLQVCAEKDCKRKGLGKKLVGEVVKEASKQEYTHVIAPVPSTNILAAKLFYACGFKAHKSSFTRDLPFFYKTLKK